MKVSRGILDDYGLDEEGVDEDGGELVHPGDGVGRDRAIFQMILCQVALVKDHSLWITFYFSREEEVVVSAQARWRSDWCCARSVSL